MIRLKPRRVDRENNNTPILSNREIDDFAHAVLQDYKPELLREPGMIDFQHFLESYLGMRMEYQHLYSEDPERPILAMTAFDKGKTRVFDEDNECVKPLIVPARTVLLDNILMEDDNESLALFSGMHEGGHILMHWHVFSKTPFNDDDYEDYGDGDYETDDELSPIVCCRSKDIESFGSKKERTAAEWREHHADYFAAATSMPNATFIPFVNRLLRENNYYKGSIKLGMDGDLDILIQDIIPEEIHEVYGTSKRAARIKLRTAGFVRSAKV